MLRTGDEVAEVIIMNQRWNNVKTFSGLIKPSCLQLERYRLATLGQILLLLGYITIS